MRFGENLTFTALSFLYPSLDLNYTYHIDHLYARSLFKANRMKKFGINDKSIIQEYKNRMHKIGNLCILRSHLNIEKSDTELPFWLESTFTDPHKRTSFIEENFIPDMDLSFKEFLTFIDERNKKLKSHFDTILYDFKKK